MTTARELIRRLNDQQERDWRKAYAAACSPVPLAFPTPDCLCDWETVGAFDTGKLYMFRSYCSPDCPDHEMPLEIP